MFLAKIQKSLEKSLLDMGYQCPDIIIDIPKNDFGHLYTNAAIEIAVILKEKNLQEFAQKVIDGMSPIVGVETITAHPSGFINFSLNASSLNIMYAEIIKKGNKIGQGEDKHEWKLIEIVSANPTGFLHLGHARNGIISDTIANIAAFMGYSVRREYLVNDSGEQIIQLINSVWYFYTKILFGNSSIPKQEISYNTPEIFECAKNFLQQNPDCNLTNKNLSNVVLFEKLKNHTLTFFLEHIKKDLNKYNIDFGTFVHETNITNLKSIKNFLFKQQSEIYKENGAVWLKTKNSPHIKDEVLIKENGQYTYFLQDILYHNYKLELLGRYGSFINVLGVDHYGHIDRMKEYLHSIGIESNRYRFVPVQLVSLVRDDKELKMSKRDGNIFLMKELYTFLNYDEVRWFLLSKSHSTTMKIDTKILKDESNNKLHYVKYTHARICQVLEKSQSSVNAIQKFTQLNKKEELELIAKLLVWPNTIRNISNSLAPHLLLTYIYELTQKFNIFYEKWTIYDSQERIQLSHATRCVLSAACSLLKIQLPKKI